MGTKGIAVSFLLLSFMPLQPLEKCWGHYVFKLSVHVCISLCILTFADGTFCFGYCKPL